MPEIKDTDILKFLEGNLKKKDKEAIRTWAYESVENAQDLAFTQKIFRASEGLKAFNPIDAGDEWTAFKDKVSSGTVATTSSIEKSAIVGTVAAATTVAVATTSPSIPSDADILNFLEGDLTGARASQVDAWIHSGDQNRISEFNITKDILDESKNLGGYKSPDVNAEFRTFTQNIKAKTTTTDNVVPMATTAATATSVTAATVTKTEVVKPTYQQVATPTYAQTQQEEKEFKLIPVWGKYLMAACVALLAGFFLWTTNPGGIFGASSSDDVYEEFATQYKADGFLMIDGSNVSLEGYSSVRYPSDIKNLDERKLYLEGQGQFDVAKNDEKPFIVEVSDDIGIRVLGTIFKVYAHEDYVKAVENIEGKVRAYSIKNPEVYVDMGPGSRYGWDGVKFVDLNKIEKVVEDNSIEYDILYVLDHLMANSAWKVISSPNMPFDEKGVVNIDLDKDLGEILNDLQDRADFEYIKLDCDNCYQITRFEQSSSQ